VIGDVASSCARRGGRTHTHAALGWGQSAERLRNVAAGDMLPHAQRSREQSMQDAFQVFCGEAEQAIAELLARGHEPLLTLAREYDAKWHPNGFLVFELGSCGPGLLRLHVWPAGPRQMRDSSAHLHTHVWDLYSRVLVGRYKERMYEIVTSDADGGREFQVARIDYARDRNALMESSVGHLRREQIVTAEAGEFHAVRAGKVHETLIASESYVATLLIVSPPRLDEALIYSDKALPAAEHSRQVLGRDERDAVLDALQYALSMGRQHEF
jgi:hypothetical protein